MKYLLNGFLALVLAIATLTLSTRNANTFTSDAVTTSSQHAGQADFQIDNTDFRAGLNAPASSISSGSFTLPHKGWQLILVSNKFFNPEAKRNSNITFQIFAQQQEKLHFNFSKNNKKQNGFFLTNADELSVTLNNTAQRSATEANLRLKYLTASELLTLVFAALFTGLLSFLLLNRFWLSFASWYLPVLTLLVYVGQTGNGMGQYAISMIMLSALHLCWLNNNKLLFHWLSFPLYLLIYPLIVLTAGRFLLYGRWQDSELIAIIQSDFQEAIDFATDFVGWHNIALYTLSIIAAGWLLTRHFKQHQPANLLPSLVTAGLMATLMIGEEYSPANYLLVQEFNQVNNDYQQEIERWQTEKEKRNQSHSIQPPQREYNDEIGVVVIGESLSKHHMGLYGYTRQTTPELSQINNLIALQDAISNHAQTLQSVFHMITSSDNQHPQKLSEAVSLINVANAAGMRTAWISNQTKLGFTNNWTSILASEADDNFFINSHSSGTGRNRSKSYDEQLFIPFDKQLQQGPNQLIFLHLFGNHSSYSKRYPFGFEKFSEEENVQIGEHSITTNDTVNSYDNAVRYNDYVMSEFIQRLDKMNCSCFLIYSSDHGEDLVHRTGHDAKLYSPLMVEIPVIIWYSDEWAARHLQRVAALQQNRQRPFMNDSLFHTVLGTMQLKPEIYQTQRDIGSATFQPVKRITLHGKQPYDR